MSCSLIEASATPKRARDSCSRSACSWRTRREGTKIETVGAELSSALGILIEAGLLICLACLGTLAFTRTTATGASGSFKRGRWSHSLIMKIVVLALVFLAGFCSTSCFPDRPSAVPGLRRSDQPGSYRLACVSAGNHFGGREYLPHRPLVRAPPARHPVRRNLFRHHAESPCQFSGWRCRT